jgi:primosomal protein N' (replication factor Y) (superfamily II helicase)
VPRSEPDATSGPDSGEICTAPRIAQVVLDAAPLHLAGPLDYLIPEAVECGVGHRVEVTLRGRRSKGLVVGVTDRTEVPLEKLRPVARVLGDFPWVRSDELDVLRWAAERFAAPLGDVVRVALPARVIDVERIAAREGWFPATATVALGEPSAASAALTRTAATALRPDGPPAAWQAYGDAGARLVRSCSDGAGSFLWRPLPGEDVATRLIELARRCLDGGRDVLMVVPDPASPTADALLASLDEPAVDVRGGPTARAAYRAWLRCRSGIVRVAVGERAAAFLPLERLGLAIVLDEASPMHKERRSPRHHVREVVLERARLAGGVGLAIGTVPSAIAHGLVSEGRVTAVQADRALEVSWRPQVQLETGELEARARISRAGLAVLRSALARGGYGVVLAARRGEGRSLVCTRCGDPVRCTSCSASVARRADGGWWCHACGVASERAPVCARCGPVALAPLAAGAERLAQELARTLDGDVAVLEGYAAEPPPPPAVLVMTRGSVLDRAPTGAPVLGVVLPDLDGALRRPVLDAAEDALRLAFVVAGWTVVRRETSSQEDGTSSDDRMGQGHPHVQVVVETREPHHHAMRALAAWDPDLFWDEEMTLRRAVRLPPAVSVLRFEVHAAGFDLPRLVVPVLPEGDEIVGPLPLEGGARAYLVKCVDRRRTVAALRSVREDLSRRGADVRLDVDPIDLG